MTAPAAFSVGGAVRTAQQHYQSGRFADAARVFRAVAAVLPDEPDVLFNLAAACKAQRRFDAAGALLRRLLRLRPEHAAACGSLGDVLLVGGRYAESAAIQRRRLALRPDDANGHNDLGNALHGLDRFDVAERCHRRALLLDPALHKARRMLGVALKAQGRIPEAVEALRGLARLAPDYAYGRATLGRVMMLTGDYREGGAEFEHRHRLHPIDPRSPLAAVPWWDGRPLPGGTLALCEEGGFGDTFQFIRYLSAAKARCGRVVVVCRPELAALLSTVPEMEPGMINPPMPPLAAKARMMSLPHLMGTTVATIPADIPYMAADPARVAVWKQRMAHLDGLRVGVVWRTGPETIWQGDAGRSPPPALFARLATVPGVRLVSLHFPRGGDEGVPAWDPGPDYNAGTDAFADTAAVVSLLDLVVAVDTSTAHVAGALGVPLWVPLKHVSEWRWLRDRDDSPWYPTARLFRQARPGDWRGVFDRMVEALAGLAAARTVPLSLE